MKPERFTDGHAVRLALEDDLVLTPVRTQLAGLPRDAHRHHFAWHRTVL